MRKIERLFSYMYSTAPTPQPGTGGTPLVRLLIPSPLDATPAISSSRPPGPCTPPHLYMATRPPRVCLSALLLPFFILPVPSILPQSSLSCSGVQLANSPCPSCAVGRARLGKLRLRGAGGQPLSIQPSSLRPTSLSPTHPPVPGPLQEHWSSTVTFPVPTGWLWLWAAHLPTLCQVLPGRPAALLHGGLRDRRCHLSQGEARWRRGAGRQSHSCWTHTPVMPAWQHGAAWGIPGSPVRLGQGGDRGALIGQLSGKALGW